MAVRAWQLSEATVASWANVGVYLYDLTQKSTTLASDYGPSSTTMGFYEVTFIDNEGSWFLATVVSDGVPTTWLDMGGVEQLQASGDEIPTEISGQPVMRPNIIFWWIPTQTLASVGESPQVFEGKILGEVPIIPPSNTPVDSKIKIERTANGVILTVPPTNANTTIQVAVGS